jgi:CRISPR-associated exonuclease Cas4
MPQDDADRELIPISALNHYAYCPRRCALIHVEQTYSENVYTMRGHDLHERTDREDESGWEEGVRVERAVPLWSKRLGLIGRADVVEFHGNVPYPVEYKHGPRREKDHDDLQLCAQALCLEEMTGLPVPSGAIFHHTSRRRREVSFSAALRSQVTDDVDHVRAMLRAKSLPPPVNDSRCRNCSLIEACMPSVIGEPQRAAALLRTLFVISEPS